MTEAGLRSKVALRQENAKCCITDFHHLFALLKIETKSLKVPLFYMLPRIIISDLFYHLVYSTADGVKKVQVMAQP